MKKVVAVLFGGKSSEYEISLMSASSIIKNLDRGKYDVINIGIGKEGGWFRYHGDLENILDDTWYQDKCSRLLINPSGEGAAIMEIRDKDLVPLKIDIVFPALHGRYGEDGAIQGLLELLDIPYVGCNQVSSAICMDKDYAHRLVEHAGIRVPQSLLIQGNFSREDVDEFLDKVGLPIYVKPVNEGSSIGITKAKTHKEVFEGIEEAFKYDNKVILEENIDGFEVACAIIGNKELLVGSLGELELADEGFLDYDEKYNTKKHRIHIPARLDDSLNKRVIETAKDIYRILGCSGLARIDMFIDKDKNIIFNEANTMPGFTANSLFPSMFLHSNIQYMDILDRLIELEIGEGR